MKKEKQMKKLDSLLERISKTRKEVKKIQKACEHEIQVNLDDATVCLFCRKKMEAIRLVDFDKPEPVEIDLDDKFSDIYEIWATPQESLKRLEDCYRLVSRRDKDEDEYSKGRRMLMEMYRLQHKLEDKKVIEMMEELELQRQRELN